MTYFVKGTLQHLQQTQQQQHGGVPNVSFLSDMSSNSLVVPPKYSSRRFMNITIQNDRYLKGKTCPSM